MVLKYLKGSAVKCPCSRRADSRPQARARESFRCFRLRSFHAEPRAARPLNVGHHAIHAPNCEGGL